MITITYDKTKHPKDFVLAQNSVKYNDYSGNVFDNELIELWKSEASKSNATIKFYTLWKDKDLLPTRIIYKKHNIILHGYWYCNDRIVQDYPILQSHNKECVSYKCINDIVTLTYDLDKWIELYEKAKEKKKRITIDSKTFEKIKLPLFEAYLKNEYKNILFTVSNVKYSFDINGISFSAPRNLTLNDILDLDFDEFPVEANVRLDSLTINKKVKLKVKDLKSYSENMNLIINKLLKDIEELKNNFLKDFT